MVSWFYGVSEKKYFPFVFFLIAFLFLSLFSWSTSPFYVCDGMDSAVFKTMGQALLKGKVLYRDIFDHKGPYLYFINALGQWLIPGRIGIFLLQVAALGAALWYMFRTARLFLGSALSLICELLALAVLSNHLCEGNQCEEWMLPAVCITFYYACRYFVKEHDREHPLGYGLIYGLCFGFSFFIRPNDAVAWMGGIMTGVTVWLTYRKKYKSAILNALCFLGGFLMMAAPVLIYFGCQGALPDMWYGLIGFNREYSGGLLLVHSFLGKRKLFMLFLLCLFVWMAYTSNYKRLLYAIVPAFLLGVLLTGVRMYAHYFICFTPFFLLFFAFFLLKFQKTCWRVAAFCMLLLVLGLYSERFAINRPIGRQYSTKHQAVYEQAERLFGFVPEYEKDSIWNYNLVWSGIFAKSAKSEFSIFCHNGIVPCNKLTIGRSERLEQEDLISRHHPKWVIFQQPDEWNWMNRTTFKEDSLYIASHYDIVAQTDTAICKLVLYKRKDRFPR